MCHRVDETLKGKIQMEEQYLIELELPIWQDPQGNVILEKCRNNCYLYFDCWEDNTPTYANYFGKITMYNAWAVKSLDVECYDIYPKEDYKYRSSIFIVQNSQWLKEMIEKRAAYYDNWTGWKDKEYKHYLIRGHDNYFEIIAEKYSIETVKKEKNHYYERLWKNE